MRLIDADALMLKLEGIGEAERQIYGNGSWNFALRCINEIESSPIIESERKKGKWIADVDRWGDVVTTVNGYICSECKVFNTDKDNYCPNCGADMRGDSDE